MARVTRYFKRGRLKGAQFRRLVWLFALDLTPPQIIALTKLAPNTVRRYLLLFRQVIAEHCDAADKLSGVVEVDESYFGPRHVKGKAGRGAGSKTIVFGMMKRGGQVRAHIIANCTQATLAKALRDNVDLASIIHSDEFAGYNGVASLGYKMHRRVRHSREFARGNCHINGIEGFWGYCKNRLARCNGVPRSTFYLHLKECEFRFNHRPKNGDDLYKILLKMFKEKDS